MATNKALGNALEDEVCDRLYRMGFWVKKLVQTEQGQPADIIAVRNRIAYLFDCKNCVNGRFELSRIEPNQITAMQFWENKDNGEGLFAIRFGNDSEIYIIPLSYLLAIKQSGKQSITNKDLPDRFTWFEWRRTH